MYSGYFLVLTSLFIACLIAANIVAVKIVGFGGYFLPAGLVIFPLSYIVGDILTELYGFKKTKFVILLGFVANFVVVSAIIVAQNLPAAPFWEFQSSYEAILGQAPRVLLASFSAYLVGSLANSWVMEKIKEFTGEKLLWVRTIGSTIVGEGLDTVIFLSVAFVGIVSGAQLVTMMLTQWLLKVAYEALATPVTYLVISRLKRPGVQT